MLLFEAETKRLGDASRQGLFPQSKCSVLQTFSELRVGDTASRSIQQPSLFSAAVHMGEKKERFYQQFHLSQDVKVLYTTDKWQN